MKQGLLVRAPEATMVTVWNGNAGNRPVRRLRFDGYPPNPEREAKGQPRIAGHSGRRAVIAAVLAIMVLAGGLALAFRDWRMRYRARAAFGREVASVIDPLAELVPPGISRGAWRGTVAEAHAMLVTLTSSNMLDLSDMYALRADLAARVRRARPETARADLGDLWDELARRAGPNLVKRHPRPESLSHR
jgi:hypothetical protein